VLPLSLAHIPDKPLRILAVGAHPDDIEIGAGGTLLALLDERADSQVRWLVLSGSDQRAAEARASAAAMCGPQALAAFTAATFRDSYFPFAGAEIKDAMAAVRADFEPDIVFAPRPDDRHQDHRLVGEVILQLYRDHLVLGYEIPKTDADLTSPTHYVPLSPQTVEAKIAHLLRYFPSQHDRPWFDASAFRAILRVRGVEAGADGGHAEGFHVQRTVLEVGR
jgi:LmbE family N-acetylglucosaminyl deacetylase